MSDASGWVNRTFYPFEPHWMEVEGGRMHYVDEGKGPVVLMVHGTPTWSFLYRDLIRSLSTTYRVIAPDHIGFGMSDKPVGWSYRPQDHARNIERLVTGLGLRDINLVVHDFGGPIGLSYALQHPENVRTLVLFNTWMWSLRGTPTESISRFMSGAVGRFLYQRLNLSPRVLLKGAFANRSRLTREVHRHYIEAFPAPGQRQAPWILARELIGSSDWYEGLWQQRERIAHKPALLLWGMKDPAFRPDALERWKGALHNATGVEVPEAGHFVQEEDPEVASREIAGFLATALAAPR